jgi:hypothetical protein
MSTRAEGATVLILVTGHATLDAGGRAEQGSGPPAIPDPSACGGALMSECL